MSKKTHTHSPQLSFCPPPSFIVSYNYPAPLAKPRLRGWGCLMHFPGCLISRDHQTTSWKSKSQLARQFIFDDLCKLETWENVARGCPKASAKRVKPHGQPQKRAMVILQKSEARPYSGSGIFCHVRRMGIVMKLVSFPHP